MKGKKIRPCFGCWLVKIPQKGNKKDGLKENPKTYHSETIRKIRELKPYYANQIYGQWRNRFQEYRD